MAELRARSVYDCLYVALAVQSKAEWITVDERLANALAARLPVKWLGGDLTAWSPMPRFASSGLVTREFSF